jgi:DNA-binding transcriptional MerR regulator
MQDGIKKLYYSISEVSEITGLKQYVLRYWESEFDGLKPTKNRAGNRIYTETDIALIRLIKQLLYEEKFTIDGAKKRLAEPSGSAVSTVRQAEIIRQIRADLADILKIV